MKKNARKIFLFFSSRTVGKKGGHPIISCNYTYCHIFVIFLDPQKTASFKLIVQEYRAKTSCGTQWKKSTLKCHEQCNIFALLLTMLWTSQCIGTQSLHVQAYSSLCRQTWKNICAKYEGKKRFLNNLSSCFFAIPLFVKQFDAWNGN